MAKPEIVEDEVKTVDVVPEANKAVQSGADMTPTGLLELAVRNGADVDKIEKLMDMKFKWEANEAKKAFTRAMSKFRGICPSIAKDGGVDFTSQKGRTNYKYSSLAGTLDTIRPILEQCGLSHTWKTETKDGLISVTCIVTHVDGHSEQTSLSAGSDTTGNKNSIQAMGSTVSYLQRYTLFAVLGLTSAEMDNDAQAPTQEITQEQIDEIEELISATKSDLNAFLGYYEIENTDQITPDIYSKAKIALKAKLQGGGK